MTNVINFPIKNPRVAPTEEETAENTIAVANIHVENILAAVIPPLFDGLSIFGIDPDEDEETAKHGTLVIEAIKSFILNHYDIRHPLQEVAEGIFVVEDDEMSFVKNITITYNKDT